MFKSLKIILLFSIVTIISMIGYAQDTINPYTDVPMSRAEDGAFILGNPDASIKLIEFADFLCPHCQEYKPTIDGFIDQYVRTGQAQFEYRMLPIIDANLSSYAASLVECANQQSDGLFWYAHDIMYEITSADRFSADSVPLFINKLDLDSELLNDCLPTAKQYEVDANLARSLKITGTPSVAIQYSGSDPLPILAPNADQISTLMNATRPIPGEPVTIETGRYAGIQTYRTDDGGIVLGDPSAPLTLVAFEDFMCPHCQAYQPTIHTFVENFVATGKAKFEYRFFPIVNPEFSMLTANVAECVALQDVSKFWEAHDYLFEFATSKEIDSEIASVIAMLVGVDAEAVVNCLDTSIQPMIDYQLGIQVKVSGTPGVRARNEDGQVDIIYNGQQVLDRGGIPIEILTALFEGDEDLSIGEPEATLFNDNLLQDTSLTTNEPCSAPCWQNITPGETTLEEARTIVEQLASATIVQDSPNGFAFTVETDSICCQIGSQDGTTVNTILLQLAPTNTLGQFIESHGEPTFVNGEEFSDAESILTILYPDLNVLLYTVVNGVDGQLAEDTPIFTVVYATEDLFNTITTTNPLDNWKGYLTFNEYMDGEFDNNPNP